MAFSRIFILMTVLLQAACSLLPDDRAMDYLQAEELPETQTPADIVLETQEAYPFPELAVIPQQPTQFEVPMPAPYVEDDSSGEVASLAQYQAAAMNPRLEPDGSGTLILRLDGGFASNWAAVTEALGRSSLKLTDLNRSTGTYYLEMATITSKDDLSWWGKLWANDDVEVTVYLLRMNRARNGVYLSLLTDADTLADEVLTRQVLTEIKRQLDK